MKPLLRVGALAALVVALFAAAAATGSLSPHRVRDWADGWGVVGPFVFIAISAALTVALVPGPLLAGASGLLFGTALGTPVSIVSATLGAAVAFALARTVARDAVTELAGERLPRVRDFLARRGFLAVLYARIAPGVPYSLVNYAAGVSPVSARAFVGATAIGCAPRAFAYTALGGSLDDLGRPEAIIAIAVLVVMALGGLVLARREVRAPGPGTGSSSPAGRSAARP